MNLQAISAKPKHLVLVWTARPASPAAPKGVATSSIAPLSSGWLRPAAA